MALIDWIDERSYKRLAKWGELKKKSKMTKKTGAYIVMIAGLILMILNIADLDFGDLKAGPFTGLVSNILLIVAMIISIRHMNKKV